MKIWFIYISIYTYTYIYIYIKHHFRDIDVRCAIHVEYNLSYTPFLFSLAITHTHTYSHTYISSYLSDSSSFPWLPHLILLSLVPILWKHVTSRPQRNFSNSSSPRHLSHPSTSLWACSRCSRAHSCRKGVDYWRQLASLQCWRMGTVREREGVRGWKKNWNGGSQEK